MPKLVLFKRTWKIASDDFVHYGIKIIIQNFVSVMLVIIPIVQYVKANEQISIVSYIYTVIAGLTIILTISLTVQSSLGFIIDQNNERKHVPFLYFATICVALITTTLTIYILVLTNFEWPLDLKSSVARQCIQAGSAIGLISGVFQLGYFFTHWDKHGRINLTLGNQELLEKKQKRLRATIKKIKSIFGSENDDSLDAIVEVVYTFIDNTDIVWSDIIVGIMLLYKQTCLLTDNNSVIPKNILNKFTIPYEGNIDFERLRRIWKFASSTYGWLIRLNGDKSINHKMDKLLRQTCCKENWQETRFEQEYLTSYENLNGIGNYRRTMIAALLANTDIKPEDVVYVSDERKHIDQTTPVFTVSICNDLEAVIVAVRGTFDLQDCLIDMLAMGEYILDEEMPREYKGTPFLVHNGVLICARKLLKILLEREILDKVFYQVSSNYQLILTGHSLGGSVAMVLGIILKNQFSRLMVYAFGPPLGTLCQKGAEYSSDFCMIVVNGYDMFSRMSIYTMIDLKRRMMESLVRCRVKKHNILTKLYLNTTINLFRRCFKMQPIKNFGWLKEIPYSTNQLNIEERLIREEDNSLMSFLKPEFSFVNIHTANLDFDMPRTSGVKVLLLLKQKEHGGNRKVPLAIWTDISQLHTLLVHPKMLCHHFINTINKDLDEITIYATENKNNSMIDMTYIRTSLIINLENVNT